MDSSAIINNVSTKNVQRVSRRWNKMREQIILVAMEEMSENGIKFTMTDLARRLQISKTTLYAQFRSKEELVGAILELLLDNFRQQNEEIINNSQLSITEKLKAVMENRPRILATINSNFILTLKRQFPNEWEKGLYFRQEKWQLIEQLIKQGMEEGCFRPIDLTVTKLIFISTANELLNPNFLIQNNLTLNDAIDKMVDILYFGICGNNK